MQAHAHSGDSPQTEMYRILVFTPSNVSILKGIAIPSYAALYLSIPWRGGIFV